MPAMPVHHTEIDNESEWDGPAEVAKAEGEDQLSYMHAWMEADADPEAKESYKFPHHAAGTDTPANMAGVRNALARLDSADIPDADREDVRTHLQAHMDDAAEEDNSEEDDGGEEEGGTEDKLSLITSRIQRRVKEHAPMRSAKEATQRHERFWRFVNAEDSESGEVELEFYGVIESVKWFDDDITPKLFKKDLDEKGGGQPIMLKIDSPGGDVFAASVIRGMLMDYRGKVTAKVVGMAASAAVMVTMGADRVQILDSAYMMVHDPYFGIMGWVDAELLEILAEALKEIKAGVVDVYVTRTGLSEKEIIQMMAAETWMSAKQAVANGFAHELVTGGAKSLKVDNLAFVNCLRNYAHVPPAIMRAYTLAPQVAQNGNAQAVADLRARVQSILKEKVNV